MLSRADFCPKSRRHQALAKRVRAGSQNSQRGAVGFGAAPQYNERHLTRAVDFNIPLITNASLATAFVRAFCSMTMDQVSVKTAGEY